MRKFNQKTLTAKSQVGVHSHIFISTFVPVFRHAASLTASAMVKSLVS